MNFRSALPVFLFVVLLSTPFYSGAQHEIFVDYGILKTKPKGGFNFLPAEWNTISYNLGYTYHRDSSWLGATAQISRGTKALFFAYPVYYACVSLPSEEIGYCVYPQRVYQGYEFEYADLYLGPTIFCGRWLRFSMGFYQSYNGTKTSGSMGIDSDYYYPYAPSDYYKRYEYGGKALLHLHLPIGKHIFLDANASAAFSFSDLRTDAWEHANALISMHPEPGRHVVMLENEKLRMRYLYFAAGIGYAFNL